MANTFAEVNAPLVIRDIAFSTVTGVNTYMDFIVTPVMTYVVITQVLIYNMVTPVMTYVLITQVMIYDVVTPVLNYNVVTLD